MNIKGPKGRGAYSAIVFIDGDLVVAEDDVGTVISEQAKSDYVSDVIQAAADEVEQGRIFVKKADEDYVIKSGVTLPTKTSFVSDGARLDLTNLNDLFLTMGSDAVYDYPLAPIEIAGFYLLGDTNNLNTKFIKATNVCRMLNIHNLFHRYMNNLIEVRGSCFDAHLTNINGAKLKGTWIKFSSFDTDGSPRIPNASTVSQCELSNSGGDTSASTGIEILASPTTTVTGIKITGIWMEQIKTPIYNEGCTTTITNCPFLQTNNNTGFVIKNVKSGAIANSAKNLYVSGCYIAPTTDAIGIYNEGAGLLISANHFAGGVDAKEMIKVDAQYQQAAVVGNLFYVESSATYAAINPVNDMTLNITSNVFTCTRSTITGKISYSLIGNNYFWGNDTYTTLKDMDADHSQIVGNYFYHGLYWINSPLLTYTLIQNNEIGSIVNIAPVVNATCKVKSNLGYLTENSGGSTGTGGQQTIAHGLSGTPNLVMVGDKEQNANPYQSAAANATNIYITAGNGLDYWWKGEIT